MTDDIVTRLEWMHSNSKILAGRPLFKEAAKEIERLRKTCGETWMAAYRLGVTHAKDGEK